MKYLLFVSILFLATVSKAQYLAAIATEWDDSFVSWQIYLDEEDSEPGTLNLKWPLRQDWTEWEYNIGSLYGNIQQQWKNDPGRWLIDGNGERITARQLFKNDSRSWRITDNSISLTVRSKWGNNFNEWEIKESTYGSFKIFMDFEGDPRDWIIIDDLSEEISLPMKMAIVFVVMYSSTPRY